MQKKDKTKKARKYRLGVLLIITSLILSGCSGLKTPEELIGPPETNLEKKMTEDTIRRFLPANSEIITPQEKSVLSTEAVYKADISGEGDREIVALYRDKASRKIGIVGIKKAGDIWSKIIDISLDAFEIADYYIVDLDSDGKSEILIGYFSTNTPFKSMTVLGNNNGNISKIYETEYLGFNITAENNGMHNIVFSTIGQGGKNNKFVIMDYSEGKVRKVDEYVYSEDIDIYKISYGSVNNEIEGFYLDMYVDESTGKTDILGKNKEGLYSILKEIGVAEIIQSIPIASVDINNDGTIELVKNSFMAQQNESAMVILNQYLSINNKNNVIPLMDIVEDHYNNIRITLPPLENWDLENNIFVNSEKDEIKLYFESQESQAPYAFMEVKISPISEGYDGEYTLIAERGNYFILGQKFELDQLSSIEKAKYDSFFDSIGNLLEIVKVIE